MKSVMKRILCLVVSACILLTVIPMMLGATANSTEPTLSSKCETVIELDGKETTFGEASSDLRINTRIQYSSARDLSAVDEIELSVYVEDAAALKDFVNDSRMFALYFSSNSRRETSTRSYADISSQIVNNGWNTVTVSRTDFTDGVNWSGIRYIYLGFTNEDASLPEKLANSDVKYKNVCDLLVVPEVTDGDLSIYSDVIINTLGDSEDSLISGTANRFSDTFDAKDISKVDIIKADFYIPNYSAFNSFLSQNKLKLSFLSENGETYIESVEGFTASDAAFWYTVQFAASEMKISGNFDPATVTGVKFEFCGADSAVLGSAYSLKIALANIRGFKYEVGEYNAQFGEEVSKFENSKIAMVAKADYSSFEKAVSGNFAALKDAEYVEFYLYVKNAESFRNAFCYDLNNTAINASLNLVLGSDNKTVTFKNIEKQVVANGWNYIILPISKAENNGFDLTSEFGKISFNLSGVDAANKNPFNGSVVVADGFIATKGTAANGQVKFDKLSDISNGKTDALKDTFANSAISEQITSISIEDAKYIEFDIYIQNFASLKSAIAQKGITGLSFRLASANGSAETDVLGLLSDGWTHLTIPTSKILKTTSGNFDASAVTKWELVYNGSSSEKTALLEGQTISILNLISAKVVNPKLPEDASVVVSEEGKSGVYGDSYANLSSSSLITLDSPVSFVGASKLEFDFYVEDYQSFKKMCSASANPLYFIVYTSKDERTGCAAYTFVDQVTGEGWNHIELQTLAYSKIGSYDSPSMENVTAVCLSFTEETGANSYADLKFDFRNICVSVALIDKVPTKSEYEVDILTEPFSTTWGDMYNYTVDKLYHSVPSIDLSKMAQVEFDIYIDNYEEFKNTVSGKAIRFVLSSGSTRFQNRAAYDLAHLITQDGWNHVVIDLNAFYLKESTDFSSIKWVSLAFWNGANVVNPIGDTVVKVANIGANYAPYDYVPALPENVLVQLGSDEAGTTSRGNTVGAYFHYTLDRIYREKLTPTDFSQSNIVEFDVYISDYEKFLAAENDPTDGQKSKLNFVVSSTKPALWDQYSTPRAYYSSGIDLANYVTHSGWNHVVVGRSEFVTKNHGVDWSGITAYMVYYRGSSNIYPYKNSNSDLYVKIANVVNTGIVANIPTDDEAQLTPDKNAVYISSVEGLSDSNGAWNAESPIINTDYKTAGKSSLQKKVNYNTELADTNLGYIFDSTVDMSDLKTLKLDFFIDLPIYLIKPTNKMEVIIGNNRFGKDDYYSFSLDLTKMKQGWNTVSLEFKNAVSVGKPDLKSAKLVMIRFTQIDLSAAAFEEIIYGIDNIRYISSTGNKILRVEGWNDQITDDETGDNENIFDGNYGDNDFNTENDENVSSNDTVDKEIIETVINKVGEPKITKVIERTTISDYLTFGIIIGIEAFVLAVGVVLFMIIYRKKKRV